MISFKKPGDIPKARLPTHLAALIETLLTRITAQPDYDPTADGYLVLVTPNDSDETLTARFGFRWSESMIEGVIYDPSARCYHLVLLRDNQCAYSIIIPDEPWLPESIREKVVAAL
jgi:hypothetical protein